MNKQLDIINLNWEALGAELARLSNEEQACFFKGFADEMNKYTTLFKRDTQLCYIADGMDNIKGLSDKQKEVYCFLGHTDNE